MLLQGLAQHPCQQYRILTPTSIDHLLHRANRWVCDVCLLAGTANVIQPVVCTQGNHHSTGGTHPSAYSHTILCKPHLDALRHCPEREVLLGTREISQRHGPADYSARLRAAKLTSLGDDDSNKPGKQSTCMECQGEIVRGCIAWRWRVCGQFVACMWLGGSMVAPVQHVVVVVGLTA